MVRRRLLFAILPVAALLTTGWLPLVNRPQLWLGLPSVLVWVAGWSLLTTPILLFALGAAEDDSPGERAR